MMVKMSTYTFLFNKAIEVLSLKIRKKGKGKESEKDRSWKDEKGWEAKEKKKSEGKRMD